MVNRMRIGSISRRLKHLQQQQVGFTYIGVLFLVVLLGISLALASTLYAFKQQRQKEKQLLFIGNQYRNAIKHYYEKTPGSIKRYPRNLKELLEDNRFLSKQRHLRRIYTDPMTLTKQWGLIKAKDGRVKGVHSLSTEKVLKVSNFSIANINLNNRSTYSDWHFVYEPPVSLKQ